MLVRGREETFYFDLPAVIGFTPTPHLSVPNIDEPHKLSLIAILVIFAPKGGSPCDGKREPNRRDKHFLMILAMQTLTLSYPAS